MRDFRDAKAMAHSLRDALKARAMEITHSESLELIAKTFGYENLSCPPKSMRHSHAPARPSGSRVQRRKRSSIAPSAAKASMK